MTRENANSIPLIKTPVSGLNELQSLLDDFIRTFGIRGASTILRSLINPTSSRSKNYSHTRFLRAVIIQEAIKAFDLKEDHFLTSNQREYRIARMACYHLVKKYTGATHSQLAQIFGKNRHHIMYFLNKCDDWLSLKKHYPHFAIKYADIEYAVQMTIAQLLLQ